MSSSLPILVSLAAAALLTSCSHSPEDHVINQICAITGLRADQLKIDHARSSSHSFANALKADESVVIYADINKDSRSLSLLPRACPKGMVLRNEYLGTLKESQPHCHFERVAANSMIRVDLGQNDVYANYVTF